MCGELQLYILLCLTHFPEVCLFQGVPLSLDQATPGAFLFFFCGGGMWVDPGQDGQFIVP